MCRNSRSLLVTRMIPAALACAYLVGVEAGASSHCWSRELEGPDTARVLPAADVNPYDPEQVVDALASDWGDNPSSARRARIALNRGLLAMDSRRVRCSIEHPCAQASWSHRIACSGGRLAVGLAASFFRSLAFPIQKTMSAPGSSLDTRVPSNWADDHPARGTVSLDGCLHSSRLV
jgi:hypothetical protein